MKKMKNKSQEFKPAVVLSTHNTGLGIIRALGQHGIPIIAVYYQKNDMGYVSKYVRDRIFAPHPEKSENQFMSLLIDLSKKYNQSILIPADDATLVTVSKNKEILSNYYIVACAEWPIIERIIQKKYVYQLAESIGIAMPKTFFPANIADARKYSKDISYPCIVKPCQSHTYFEHFKRKMVKAANPEQLLYEYNRISDAGMETLFQEHIPGPDSNSVNYNSYFWEGQPLVEFTAQKLRQSPPEFGVPAVVMSKEIPELMEPGRKIIKALGIYGYCCTEFKKDSRDGQYKFMEVNGRHNRSLLLSVKCGVNFPLIEYKHLVFGELPSAENYKEGVYWIDFTRDLFSLFQHAREKPSCLLSYFKPYLKRNIYAELNIKDPLPFMKRCTDIFGMACKKVLRSSR